MTSLNYLRLLGLKTLLPLCLLALGLHTQAQDNPAADSGDKAINGRATYDVRKVEDASGLNTTRTLDRLLPDDAPLRVRWALPLSGAQAKRIHVPPQNAELRYVVVETVQNDLIAVRRDNGEAVWWVKCQEPVLGDIFFGSHSILFVSGGRIIRIEKMSGDLIWNVSLPFPAASGPAAIEDGRNNIMVVVPGLDRGVYGFDVMSEDWSPEGGADVAKRAKIAVTLHHYRQLWRYNVDGVISNNMIFSGVRVFSGCWNKTIYGIDVTGAALRGSPERVWKYPANAGSQATPLADGPYILVSSLDGNLYCLDRQSGGLVWRYVAADKLYTRSQLFYDEVIDHTYLAQKVGRNGPLLCLDRISGDPLWQYDRGVEIIGRQIQDNADRKMRMLMLLSEENGGIAAVRVSAPDKRDSKARESDYLRQKYSPATVAWRIENAPFASYAANAYEPYVFCLTNDRGTLCALESNE